jgi:membrane protein YdbS with pleckstrin-like domain
MKFGYRNTLDSFWESFYVILIMLCLIISVMILIVFFFAGIIIGIFYLLQMTGVI